jgi:hypothetical protein
MDLRKKELLTLAEECKANDAQLYEKLVKNGDIKSAQELTSTLAEKTVADESAEDFESIKKSWTEMLDGMEKEIEIQKSDPEIMASGEGFSYPYEEFFVPFKEEVVRVLECGKIPDVGIVGYGSLGSKKSTSETLEEEAKREWVLTRDIQRGLFLKHYSAHSSRLDDFWSKDGAHKNDESGEMAIRYKKGQLMNGVRISGLSGKEIQDLREREFCYFLLPIGQTWTVPNDEGNFKTHKLNMAAWPIGRNLTKKIRGDLREKWISLPRYERDLKTENAKKDREMFETAHTLHLNGLKTDIHYTEVCLDMGGKDNEEIFLDTTYVPQNSGAPVTLREYLSTKAPANNPEEREYFGERLNKKIFKWDEAIQKFVQTGTVKIKATDPIRRKSWYNPS